MINYLSVAVRAGVQLARDHSLRELSGWVSSSLSLEVLGREK